MDIGTQILLNNALQHIREKDLKRAGDLLTKAYKSSPNDPDVLRLLSVVAALEFNYGAALEFIDQVISLKPDNGVAHSNRGNILKELHRYEEALESFDRAITLQPTYAEAYSNKGNALQDLHRHEESLLWYEKAIELQPYYVEAYSNKGNAFEWLRRHSEAMDSYDKATAINPEYIDAYWHKAMSQLRCGDFTNGWRNYEARWSKSHPISFQFKSIPRLENLNNLSAKKILIWSEQGLGDTFQFCRYIKLLADLGCKITFIVQSPLMRILTSLETCCTLVESLNGSIEGFDYQSPLLSLPLIFQTTIKTIPVDIPYISFDKAKKQEFQARLGESKNLKVGLVWNGGFRADHPELWDINNRRNIPLEKFSKLKNISGVDFYSLQKGDPAEAEFNTKKAKLWPDSVNCASWLSDFSDTAALIENLDLVISVDTSTAHLVGALGKPVWVLNRYDSCWRWLRGRSDSPWYPSAKIYQQPKPGDWASVLEQVKIDLTALALKHLNQ